jgi:uncharacterized membrane protein
MPFRPVLWLHIAAGAIALAVFWIPLATAKGGRVHRLVGKVYVYAMAAAVAAALGVVAVRLFVEQDPRRRDPAVFLAFIALLTFANGWYGVRVLRTKNRRAPHDHPLDLGISALLLVTGLAVLGWGVVGRDPLACVFGALGSALGARQLQAWRTVPERPRAWWFQHMGGMCGACIGTVTAFVVVNAPRLGLAQLGLVPWVVPGTLGGVGIFLGTRYYERKFARAAQALRPPGGA